MSSNNLDKYEYLTGKDLDLKPSTAEQAKFKYSLMGKIFNKRFNKDEDKEEELLKRLRNIEDNNEEQLQVLKYQSEKQPIISKVKCSSFNNVSFKNLLDTKSVKVFNKIRDQDEIIDYLRLNFIGSSKKYTFNFENLMSLRNPAKIIYNGFIRCCKTRTKKNVLEKFIDRIWLRKCIKIKRVIFF